MQTTLTPDADEMQTRMPTSPCFACNADNADEIPENGGEKLGHGSGGVGPLRAAQ
jgi:hypothetical protein